MNAMMLLLRVLYNIKIHGDFTSLLWYSFSLCCCIYCLAFAILVISIFYLKIERNKVYNYLLVNTFILLALLIATHI